MDDITKADIENHIAHYLFHIATSTKIHPLRLWDVHRAIAHIITSAVETAARGAAAHDDGTLGAENGIAQARLHMGMLSDEIARGAFGEVEPDAR